MDPIPIGGIPASFQVSLPDPNAFQTDTETTIDGMVNAVLYWQQLLSHIQPYAVSMHPRFSIYLTYELHLLHNEEHMLYYWHSFILGHDDNLWCCILEWTVIQ